MSKHEEIADSLTRDILTGQYRVGERLPSERDLSSRFEANRGAVREAMKKLEQLGIADIQPGGARVAPLNQASLDVIGHLMALGDYPDRDLVDQIMVVLNSLVTTAVVSAVRRADDEGIEQLRSLMRPIWTQKLEGEDYFQAQANMFEGMMTASGNLPVQLIARSLLAQFQPQMAALKDYMDPQNSAHAELARKVDAAIGSRDLDALKASFNELSTFHRERMQRTFDAFEAAQLPASLEVSAS
jgi:DNA-binding FadR family transcriptional regulator